MAEDQVMKTQEGDLMTIAEVAKLCGLRKYAFYHGDAGTRDIPYIKLGGSIRYRRSDVEKWLERNTHQPVSIRDLRKRA
jgi:excisionase family DNA binding protein